MLKEFSAPLRKGENKGAWTYVVNKETGETVVVRLDERIG